MSLQFEDHTALREFERMLDQSFGTYDEDLKKITKEEERNESNFEEKKDIFLVDWQSTADPAKPLNWGRKKWINVGIVSFITFLSSLASSMFAPGIPSLMKEFGRNDNLLASLVLSVYVLGFGVGPTLLAPLSEFYGRVVIYHATNVLFLLFTLACGLSQDIGMLVAFRFLAGCAGAAPLAIGGGTIVDLVEVKMRGRVMTVFSMGPLLGPVIGPALGGAITQNYGWRATFWVLCVISAATTIASLLFLSETYAKILLERKAEALRKTTGDNRFRSVMASNLSYKTAFAGAIVMPLKLLATQTVLTLLSVYMALIYGYLYLFFTTFTRVFTTQYQFSTAVVGLSFGGMGIGFTAGVILMYLTGDKLLKNLTEKNGGVSKPEFRLPPMVYSFPVLPLGVLLYGWTAEFKLHWILPQIGTALVAFGLILVLMPLQTYLIDAYTSKAASALAAATILRCFVAAFLPLAGQPMYDALGLGWGNTLLAGVALVMGPLGWYCMKYGEGIREKQKRIAGFGVE